MTRPQPRSVTPLQWLAVGAIWGLVAYGALAAPGSEGGKDQVHLIACR